MSADGRAFVDTNVLAYSYDTATEAKRAVVFVGRQWLGPAT